MPFRWILKFLVCVCLLDAGFSFAARSTDKQLAKQRAELKSIEASLAKQRKQVKLLESEEKGVLNTIALLDENLNRTREYVSLLSKNESTVKQSLKEINRELDSLDREIKKRSETMKRRIRELYVHGDMGTIEAIYGIFRGESMPDRQAYYVNRLLVRDREMVETLSWIQRERALKKRDASNRLSELRTLQSKKAKEEAGLESQRRTQGSVLAAVQKNKTLQEKAIREIERNQKAMLSLIRKLEKKRAKEIAEAKKAQKKRKSKKESGGKAKTLPKMPVKPIGPKCVPLDGAILSEFGMHEHRFTHPNAKFGC